MKIFHKAFGLCFLYVIYNSALTTKAYDLISYDTEAIKQTNIICKKSGNVVSVSGYFNSTKTIAKNINFLHVNDEIRPKQRTYFLMLSPITDNPKYAKIDAEGYVQSDYELPAGYYFFNFSYIL